MARVGDGLLAGTRAQATGVRSIEVGNKDIKRRRRSRVVPVEPGGVVADYAPFYFAPRSPMMYLIEKDGVATYAGGCAHRARNALAAVGSSVPVVVRPGWYFSGLVGSRWADAVHARHDRPGE